MSTRDRAASSSSGSPYAWHTDGWSQGTAVAYAPGQVDRFQAALRPPTRPPALRRRAHGRLRRDDGGRHPLRAQGCRSHRTGIIDRWTRISRSSASGTRAATPTRRSRRTSSSGSSTQAASPAARRTASRGGSSSSRDAERREKLADAVYEPTNVRGAQLVIAIVGTRPLDLGRCAQNMMLAAWNDGVASCPERHRGQGVRPQEVLGLEEPPVDRAHVRLPGAAPARGEPHRPRSGARGRTASRSTRSSSGSSPTRERPAARRGYRRSARR